MGVKFQMTVPQLEDRLRSRLGEIRLALAAGMQTNRALLFSSGGTHNGHLGWDQLKFRSGQPLKDRGTLAKSIGPKSVSGKPGRAAGTIVRITAQQVVIGTNLLYAAMMNWGTTKMPGGKLVPKNAKALKIPLPAGKNATEGASRSFGKLNKKTGKHTIGKGQFIFRRSVKIPARRFDTWSALDKREMNLVLRNKLTRILMGKK